MKSELNKELIEGLSESANQKFIDSVNELVYNLVSTAVENVSLKSPFVVLDKCVLLSVNEVYTGAFTQLSTFDYFLGIDNPQIEMNTKLRKNFWKFVWREFRASWRLGRKKYKKKKKEEIHEVSVGKYQLSDFRHDIVEKLSELLTSSSIIYEYNRSISIVGKDDFGTNVRVNLYICAYDMHSGDFKLYTNSRNKFKIVNFGDRFDNLEYKKAVCGDVYTKMLRVFNSIYSKKYNKIPNQVLLESLLFNCPNILFDKNDIYKTFVNVANYIRFKQPNSFVSISDTSKSVFEDGLIVNTGKQVEFGKIINMLDEYKY